MAASGDFRATLERISATVAGLALGVLLATVFAPAARAQVSTTAPSVTSIGFGGHYGPSPLMPSVTSIRPNGFESGSGRVFGLPAAASGRPTTAHFGAVPDRPITHDHGPNLHHRGPFLPAGEVYAVPYLIPYGQDFTGDQDVSDSSPQAQDQEDPNDYRGGPTIFDRRGPGTPPRAIEESYSSASSSAAAPDDGLAVSDQPETVLVFKDGHQLEVQNYAVVGATLFDLTPGHRQKIAIADLDLPATAKQNDDRGIDFQLPASSRAN
ncbi:MAG TPA: hypothetical protein VLW25_04160 [Bryobacteraceae bacterium]|nr:hypothetical protein [Bryobacteraceae bacterium]